jgi:localization factor PodJL
MRAELPWNVAGIPPEAREAARAAARREGLSVGEWLTRRILRSFSDLGDDPMPFDRHSYGAGGMPLDSWGLPQSAAARRDSEEMLARVSRSETESTESWRRIEDQLRGVARRLDSSERSQSENNRVLSKTAAEMNITAREQAQAFDQMSQTIVAISERLERLERDKATDGVKDAVKALHQGLSRLADQIGQTASQSATQVTAVTQNLDQLAHRLAQAREDADHNDKILADRIAEAAGRLGDTDLRVANTETRLANIEKTVQFATNALDHTLEKLEAAANQRANDQVEWQRRAGVTEENVVRLEEAVARLERAGSDPAVDRRLDGIESSLHGMVARLENYNPAATLEETIRVLAHRLDAMERQQTDLVNEMRANIVAAPAARAEPAFTAAPSAFTQPAAFEAPPFAEAPPPAADPDANPFIPAYGTETFSPDAFAAGQFSEAPAGEDPFAPLDGMIEPAAEAGEENFLAAARRSAREAAEKNEAQKKSRFRWGKSADAEGGSKKSLKNLLILAAVVAVVAIGAALLSQRLARSPAEPAAAPPAQNNEGFVEAPAAGMPDNGGEAQPESQQQPAENTPPAAAPQAAAPAGPPSLERIAQLADGGNAVAQTIIGLRALGANGSGVNAAEAFKWLSRAAEQGHAVAQYRLGTLYERGQGVAANPQAAARWYQAAANQGNRLAMYNLAVAMANRSLGQPNMPEAARWFSRAAGLGVGDAQFNLAVLYERGDGVPQSLVDAYKWYSIAGAAGDNGAQQRAAVLATQLSETDRTAAQRSASGFRAQPLARAANVPPEPADLAGR